MKSMVKTAVIRKFLRNLTCAQDIVDAIIQRQKMANAHNKSK